MTPVFTFTKTDTQAAKGGAIVLMLFHHLFSYSKIRLPYFTLLPARVIQIFSEFGNICIAMFLLLSGFGLYHVSSKYNLKSWAVRHTAAFLGKYLCVFVLFIPAGFWFFGKEFNGTEFMLNLFCIQFTYNEEWWFIRLYVEILLLSPFLIGFLEKHTKSGIALSAALSFLGLFMRLKLSHNLWLSAELSQLFMWQLMFTAGWLCARYRYFQNFQYFFWKWGLNQWYIYLLLLLAVVILRQAPFLSAKLKDPLLAPLFTAALVSLFKIWHLLNPFAFLGRHSGNMWLVHTFFCYYYFTHLVFLPYFSLLILLWLILLSLGASYIIMGMEAFIMKGWKKYAW